MTALLMLKTKYGLDPNMTSAGLSPNSVALVLKEEDQDDFDSADPESTFSTDCGVEGLSLGYALLMNAIEREDELALRRLISLGTSVVVEDDSFFGRSSGLRASIR